MRRLKPPLQAFRMRRLKPPLLGDDVARALARGFFLCCKQE